MAAVRAVTVELKLAIARAFLVDHLLLASAAGLLCLAYLLCARAGAARSRVCRRALALLCRRLSSNARRGPAGVSRSRLALRVVARRALAGRVVARRALAGGVVAGRVRVLRVLRCRWPRPSPPSPPRAPCLRACPRCPAQARPWAGAREVEARRAATASPAPRWRKTSAARARRAGSRPECASLHEQIPPSSE
jgi:hypothetical protein